jgi:hypothetical protein
MNLIGVLYLSRKIHQARKAASSIDRLRGPVWGIGETAVPHG